MAQVIVVVTLAVEIPPVEVSPVAAAAALAGSGLRVTDSAGRVVVDVQPGEVSSLEVQPA